MKLMMLIIALIMPPLLSLQAQAGPGNSRLETGEEKVFLVCDEGTVSIEVGKTVTVSGVLSNKAADAVMKSEPLPTLNSGIKKVTCSEARWGSTRNIIGLQTGTSAGYACNVFADAPDWTTFRCANRLVRFNVSDKVRCHFKIACL